MIFLLILNSEADRAIVSDLFAKNYHRMKRTAMGILGESAAAEDVVQDTFVRCIKRVDSLRARIDRSLAKLMSPGELAKRWKDAGFLAEAYNTKGCAVYKSKDALEAIVAFVDAESEEERRNPGFSAKRDPWCCSGSAALAVGRVGASAIAPYLEDPQRRARWREYFLSGVDYLSSHRRFFANQSQIVDTYAHWCNRALKICDPKAGPPLAETRGLLVITDSDSAGFVIRNHLRSCIPPEQIKHAYIPDVPGKERRKASPSKEGKLGVEGMSTEALMSALRRAGVLCSESPSSARGETEGQQITRADFYRCGLSGGENSSAKRAALLRHLGLPEKMTAKALLGVINDCMTSEEFYEYFGR